MADKEEPGLSKEALRCKAGEDAAKLTEAKQTLDAMGDTCSQRITHNLN